MKINVFSQLTRLLAFVFLLIPALVHAAYDGQYTRSTLLSSTNSMVSFARAANGVIYLTEKQGVVRVFKDGALLATPFIDLKASTHVALDEGLLGITLHPEFPTKPYVYVSQVFDPPGFTQDPNNERRASRILILEADSTKNYLVAKSQRVLVGTNSTAANIGNPKDLAQASCEKTVNNVIQYVEDCIPADANSHTLGDLKFGPDGNLYISSGDGNTAKQEDRRSLRAQSIDSLAGKILRVDPLTGKGLTDNPFYNGSVSSNRSRVWAYGFRNPFRSHFSSTSSTFYVGDVGWNAWEEINIITKGKNYGWPCYEGSQNGKSVRQPSYEAASFAQSTCKPLYDAGDSGVSPAFFSYQHRGEEGASSLMSSIVPRKGILAHRQGWVAYFDYNQNIFEMLDPEQPLESRERILNTLAPSGKGPVQAEFDSDGRIWLLTYNPQGGSELQLLTDSLSPSLLQASIKTDKTHGSLPLTINFDGSSSIPGATPIKTYSWKFSNGTTATGSKIKKIFTKSGKITATLTVKDANNKTATASLDVFPGNTPPTVTLSGPTQNIIVGNTISYQSLAKDTKDGDISSKTKWKITLHHNEHVHPDELQFPNGKKITFNYSDHGDNSWLEICASVADSAGQSSPLSCLKTTPKAGSIKITSNAVGGSSTYEGRAVDIPNNLATYEGASRALSARIPHEEWDFQSWTINGSTSNQSTQEFRVNSTGIDAKLNYSFPTNSMQHAALYNFQENNGHRDARDVFGKSPLLISDQSPVRVDGKYGKGISLNGTQCLRQNSKSLDMSKGLTVATWVNFDSITNSQTLVSRSGVNLSSFWLQMQPTELNGAFGFQRRESDVSGSRRITIASTTKPLPGIWYFVAGVYDPITTKQSIYVNGNLEGSLSDPAPAWNSTSGANFVGCATLRGVKTTFVQGTMDEVSFFNRALSAAEIRELYLEN